MLLLQLLLIKAIRTTIIAVVGPAVMQRRIGLKLRGTATSSVVRAGVLLLATKELVEGLHREPASLFAAAAAVRGQWCFRLDRHLRKNCVRCKKTTVVLPLACGRNRTGSGRGNKRGDHPLLCLERNALFASVGSRASHFSFRRGVFSSLLDAMRLAGIVGMASFGRSFDDQWISN